MAIRLPNWRAEEDSIEEIIKRYPTVSPFVILKTDVNRRGYILSEDAQKLLDPSIHQSKSQGIFHKTSAPVPRGLLLRDGTSICGYDDNHDVRDPYVVEVIDGKLTLTDNGKTYETVEYWRKPDYYDKTTSKGTPMWQILNCRPNRLDLYLNHHCHFWDEPGGGCKYCTIGAASAQSTKNHVPDLLDFDEVQETFEEALKQKGRFTGICASCGTILSGNEIFDDEVELYVNVLGRLREIFKTDYLHVQLVGSPYSQKQLERLKNEAGLIALTSDIEVLNDELFQWICPGKAKHVGYEGWKKRLIDAVEVLGKGGVNSGIVGGVETATPNGFTDEKKALASTLEQAEELGSHGVSVINTIWGVGGQTIFRNQIPPSLDYYVQLAKGLNDIREKYEIPVYQDDYKHCGNHPGTDLSRI